MLNLLGIDNVFFVVTNLEQAIAFYQKLGFKLKFKIPKIQVALFSIGTKEPGLMICEKEKVAPSRLWVEVESAEIVKKQCEAIGLDGKLLEAATGLTFELSDDSGNIIGFADYTKKPELSRSLKSEKAL